MTSGEQAFACPSPPPLTRWCVLSSSVGRLRLLGMIEGLSYVLLLGVAMPLKYLAGMPMAVRVVGTAHGILFVAYFVALALATLERRWPLSRVTTLAVASLLPFGPLFVDGFLSREAREPSAAS